MSALPIISFIMLALLLMNMLAKSRPISKSALPGKTLKVVSMSIVSRIWVHRFGLVALITGLALSYLAGWLPGNLVAMIAAFALVIVLLPMKLILTSQGLGIGDATYRSWKDFSSLKVKKASIELGNSSVFVRTVLFLRPADKQQVIKLLENHIPVLRPNG
jgi:hypothetical protein